MIDILINVRSYTIVVLICISLIIMRSSIPSAKKDQELTVTLYELLIAKFRLKLKKVGETTRPFRNYLNQIPYDFIVEGTNRLSD